MEEVSKVAERAAGAEPSDEEVERVAEEAKMGVAAAVSLGAVMEVEGLVGWQAVVAAEVRLAAGLEAAKVEVGTVVDAAVAVVVEATVAARVAGTERVVTLEAAAVVAKMGVAVAAASGASLEVGSLVG